MYFSTSKASNENFGVCTEILNDRNRKEATRLSLPSMDYTSLKWMQPCWKYQSFHVWYVLQLVEAEQYMTKVLRLVR